MLGVVLHDLRDIDLARRCLMIGPTGAGPVPTRGTNSDTSGVGRGSFPRFVTACTILIWNRGKSGKPPTQRTSSVLKTALGDTGRVPSLELESHILIARPKLSRRRRSLEIRWNMGRRRRGCARSRRGYGRIRALCDRNRGADLELDFGLLSDVALSPQRQTAEFVAHR